MTSNPFTPGFADLPGELPIFPLSNTVLLPREALMLNIFEPRYLSMVRAALGSEGRLIGMIQPRAESARADRPETCRVGCAGRITAFQELEDGRFVIALTGVCRFVVADELPEQDGFRRVVPDWHAYAGDLSQPAEPPLTLEDLELPLRRFLRAHGLDIDFKDLRELSPSALTDFLATKLPFAGAQKQSFLEAATSAERGRLLIAALQMATPMKAGESETRH